MIAVSSLLATALDRRDEESNIALAEKIVAEKDTAAVQELIALLGNKKLQNDAIKVLYEAAERNVTLILPHISEFVALLSSKNNRLQWGAMTALYQISKHTPKEIHTVLTPIVAAADKGSVITTDNAVLILVELCGNPAYASDAFPLLSEQLLKSPVNQLPMYAEKSLPIINAGNKSRFLEILTSRLPEIDKESKRKRVEKVFKKIG